MTIGMVLIMVAYNSLLLHGFTTAALRFVATQFVPIFIAAFIVERLFVSHNVHRLHKILVKPHATGFAHIIAMAVLMVTGMCLSMTLYTTLLNVGTGPDFWRHFLAAVTRNYPVALVAQLIVVGPLVRLAHMRLFEPTKLVD